MLIKKLFVILLLNMEPQSSYLGGSGRKWGRGGRVVCWSSEGWIYMWMFDVIFGISGHIVKNCTKYIPVFWILLFMLFKFFLKVFLGISRWMSLHDLIK